MININTWYCAIVSEQHNIIPPQDDDTREFHVVLQALDGSVCVCVWAHVCVCMRACTCMCMYVCVFVGMVCRDERGFP